MAELMTQAHAGGVEKFLAAIADTQQRADADVIVDIMRTLTKCEPQMWGQSIIGFGSYHFVYESGRELDWFATGFSPRARNLTLYIMGGFAEEQKLLARLGKHKIGKSCLYINKLEEVDLKVLRELVKHSVAYVDEKYEATAEQPVAAKPAKKPAAKKKAAAKKPVAKKSATKKSAAKKPAVKKAAAAKKPAAKKPAAKKKSARRAG
jgi:flagellar biosynthesis GTPase FlhF